jgi:DNA-binding NarL/FixJ family response regulator
MLIASAPRGMSPRRVPVCMSKLRPRVLLADDYADLLAAFTRLLAPSCDVVGCVSDGDALFESMARLQPDVIVVDLFMPPGSGLEICRRIKHVAPDTPVIIVSASTDADIAEEARRAGASALVNKTAAVDDLVPAIQRAMATRSA